MTAVVTLAGDAAASGPGVHVLAHLRGIGSEVVRATPAGLAGLRSHPQVTGVRTDGPVSPTNADLTSLNEVGSGVYAWQGLGGGAGAPGAGRNVTVAVVDTGISDTPALNRASGRLVDGVDTSALVAEAAVDSDQDSDQEAEVRTEGAFTDGFGHGTFLANVIAGGDPAAAPPADDASSAESAAGHSLGVAPGARVVSVKVADDTGATSLAAVLAGLDWVVTHRPIDVVSLALAADRPGDAYGADPLTAAVQHLLGAGLTVVAAAGNTAGELADPGFDPHAITVGAADTTTAAVEVAPFSGSGMVHGVRKPDVVAPGVRVLSLLPAESEIARNNPDAQLPNGLWRGSGTSPATAVAAGVAAIYLAEHPNATHASVKAMLRGAAAPMDAWQAGTGLIHTPGTDTEPNRRGGCLDETAWSAAGWNSPDWAAALDASWTKGVWTAKSWSSNPWSAATWSAKSWSAKSWSAKSWSAKSWSAKRWSAKSWSAKSWSAKSWSAKSWSAYGWTGPVAR